VGREGEGRGARGEERLLHPSPFASRPSLYDRALALLDHPAVFNLSQLLISAGQRPTKRRAEAWLDLRPGERLLDVCCGTGEFCQLRIADCGLRNRDDEGAYLGIDLNPRYIAYARRRYGRGGRREFCTLDATRMSLPAGSFDKALFVNSLHHFPDDLNRGILREVARVLKPGGRLVLIDMVGDDPRRIQRFFLDRDRGHHLRPLDRQRALVGEYFAIERSATFDSGFTPQTIIAAVPTCRQPATSAESAEAMRA
jgi:SAM-dependent methyltransferase